MSPMEATVDPLLPGSRLDADHPENGVLIPRRSTGEICRMMGISKPTLYNYIAEANA